VASIVTIACRRPPRPKTIGWLAGSLATLLLATTLPGQTAPTTLGSGPTAAELLNPHQRVAIVGDRMILAGDVLPAVRQALKQMLAPYAKTMPPAELQRQWELGLPPIFEKLLRQKIDLQLVYLDFENSIPPDKLKSVSENIKKQVNKQFYEHEIESLEKQLNVNSITDLDHALKQQGSSIPHQKEEYRQQMIAQTMVSKNVKKAAEITPDQLLDYYREHADQYEITARAKWEKLTARFDRFPNRAAAERAIVEMGNQVLRGAPLAAVAKRLSQGELAANGGHHDWTSRHALKSKAIDQAIFQLPVGQLSQILTDETGFHIVRVTRRQEAGKVPFTKAQETIRKTLEKQQRADALRHYVEKLRHSTYVWTIFDPPTASTASAPGHRDRS